MAKSHRATCDVDRVEGTLASGAIFDCTRLYRYALWRVWNDARPRVAFILLNPSTADATRNDPTIRRCIGYAHAWGYGGVDIVNIFAFRSTNPLRLQQIADPVGPGNDAHILRAAQRSERAVCAWGVHGRLLERGAAVVALLRPHCRLHALRWTQCGAPRHPLYLPAALRPSPWLSRRRPAAAMTK